MDFIDNYFLELFAFVIVLNAAVLIASVIYRRRKLANQAPFDESTLSFNESGVSGNSDKNLLTRLGGASGVLKVSVNDEEVYIRPSGPFLYGFLPELLDLEHRVSLDRILSVKPTTGLAGNEGIQLTFSDESGQDKVLNLYLKKDNEFKSVLQQFEGQAV